MKLLNQNTAAFTEAREAAELTKTALARRLGCSLSLISEIEGGTRNAQPALLRAAAKVLGVPVADLKRREDTNPVRVDDQRALDGRDESRRPTTEAAPEDLRDVQHGERAEPVSMPQLLGSSVTDP